MPALARRQGAPLWSQVKAAIVDMIVACGKTPARGGALRAPSRIVVREALNQLVAERSSAGGDRFCPLIPVVGEPLQNPKSCRSLSSPFGCVPPDSRENVGDNENVKSDRQAQRHIMKAGRNRSDREYRP